MCCGKPEVIVQFGGTMCEVNVIYSPEQLIPSITGFNWAILHAQNLCPIK
uniref:Uncharacterized protein n=1 Tax=Anguilla anguilla TaxID=7936 RepID=A0A0E9PQT8_ANGAN